MTNLMLYEMTCGNPVTPYRLTQSVSRWGLSEGQGFPAPHSSPGDAMTNIQKREAAKRPLLLLSADIYLPVIVFYPYSGISATPASYRSQLRPMLSAIRLGCLLQRLTLFCICCDASGASYYNLQYLYLLLLSIFIAISVINRVQNRNFGSPIALAFILAYRRMVFLNLIDLTYYFQPGLAFSPSSGYHICEM